jgi:DNA-binding transcriptional ArsR family regulator
MLNLDRTLSALAHPVRRGVLAQLRRGEAPVKDLAAALKVGGPTLTRHLHMLEDAGLITRGRVAQQRPCRLSPKPLKEIDEWMESYRQFWADTFDRLDAHLHQVQQPKKSKKRKP